jgi:nitrogen fixation protein FixH
MKRERGGWHWPAIIIGLLVTNAVGVGILVTAAGADSGHAVEPNYYQKALDWDDEMAQQRTNRELGWQLEPALVRNGDAVELTVSLSDASGASLDGAAIDLITFHRARAANRLELTLTGAGDGSYRTAWRSPRDGLWELRFVVSRGDDRFTRKAVVQLGGDGG